MSIIRAIIFDLDGVLVNTIEMHYQAWREVAQSGGRDLTYAEMETLRGVRRDKCLDMLFPDVELTSDKIDYFLQIKHRAYINSLTQKQPHDVLMPKTLDLLQSAQQMNLKLGVASSSVNAFHVLEHVDLLAMFDVIADGVTVARSKPEPDIFLWAAGGLGVYPEQAIVFEDSVAGTLGAKQAGMHTVGVFNPETRHYADQYFENLIEIDLPTLLSDLKTTAMPSLQRSPIGDSNARN